MPKLYQHQLDDTYYTRLYWPGVSAIVTRQIHPDGVVFLKRQGVQLEGDIPLWLVDELKKRNWLATKEEMPHWGIVVWPKWHLIDAPKPKPFPKGNPFVTKKREAARAAKLAAQEEQRRATEAAERQELEQKRAANRERGRRYRAKKKAEAKEAERKAEARRERDRRYRAKKRAEVEAAQEAASTVESPPDPHDDVDTPPETRPANHITTTMAKHDERQESTRTPHDSLTQLAPRPKLIQPERLATPSFETIQEPEQQTPRLVALVGIVILLVLTVEQVWDVLPI